MRIISDKFVSELSEGILAPLTKMVKSDTSLCLELRGCYINIYYRGGNLMKVDATESAGIYTIYFDPEYFKYGTSFDLPQQNVQNKGDVERWLSAAPYLKRAIDNYFANIRKDEREFQQTILRDNNFGSIARSTDYYICDIEYDSGFGQFDMIAVHWPSNPGARQVPRNRQLVFVEVKHGDNALANKSGLHAHINDINSYASVHSNLQEIKEEMVEVFNQKRRLGLIDCGNDLNSFSDTCPILILALINHDPEKSKLRDLLNTLPESAHVELRIATASFLGYGLYDQGIHSLDKARKYLGRYIYHKELAPL